MPIINACATHRVYVSVYGESVDVKFSCRWWQPQSCPYALDAQTTGTRQALSFQSISGIFVVMLLGVSVSVVAALVTRLFYCRRKQRDDVIIASKECDVSDKLYDHSESFVNNVVGSRKRDDADHPTTL